jgi:hypothetical protein
MAGLCRNQTARADSASELDLIVEPDGTWTFKVLGVVANRALVSALLEEPPQGETGDRGPDPSRE